MLKLKETRQEQLKSLEGEGTLVITLKGRETLAVN